MSHRATNWALKQRHLKPATWIVLIQLADRRNKATLQINPEQATLAADCNMARSTVNNHLDLLESNALLIRVPRKNPSTKKQLSTFYVLAIDFGAPPQIEHAEIDYLARVEEVLARSLSNKSATKTVTSAVSEKRDKPCPNWSKSRVRNPYTNPVREPRKKPVRAAGATLRTHPEFEEFWATHPRPLDRYKSAMLFSDAIENGTDSAVIVAGAKAYRAEQACNCSQYVKTTRYWLAERRWEDHIAKLCEIKPEPDVVAAQTAMQIWECKPWVASFVSANKARQLIAAGLVSEAQCKAAGVL